MVRLDKCNGNYNTLDNSAGRICVPNKKSCKFKSV